MMERLKQREQLVTVTRTAVANQPDQGPDCTPPTPTWGRDGWLTSSVPSPQPAWPNFPQWGGPAIPQPCTNLCTWPLVLL